MLCELNLPHLTNADISLLMQPLAREEVQHALFSLANDKSAGLDGFNAEFFKTYWSTVGDCVTESIQIFFVTGHLLKEWNRTLLILIPKTNLPIEVN